MRRRIIDHTLHIGLRRHVGDDSERLPSSVLHLTPHAIKALSRRRKVVQSDVEAIVGESEGDGAPDAA